MNTMPPGEDPQPIESQSDLELELSRKIPTLYHESHQNAFWDLWGQCSALLGKVMSTKRLPKDKPGQD